MGKPRFPDKRWITAGQNIQVDGQEVGIFLFTTECTDGSLWSRVVRTDGIQTDGWFMHPDIPDRE